MGDFIYRLLVIIIHAIMNKIYMIRVYLGIFMLIVFSVTNGVSAAMSSTNYQINFDAISSGGTDFSSSSNYQLNDTVGEQGTGYGTSSNFRLHAGYRQRDKETPSPTLEFILGAQENDTQTAYTALSIAGKTVTVSDTTYFATGTRIGVVENQGLNQNFIVGKIIAVNGLILTVDKWEGMTGAISGSPTGADDFVYRTEGHTVALGTLDTLGSAGIVQTEVSTNAANGYTLQIRADGNLRIDATHSIDNVADDSVTAGSNEYGARVYGSNATGTGLDFPVTTSYRDIQKSTTTAVADRVGMLYKASIDYSVSAGNYQQSVQYLLTANF